MIVFCRVLLWPMISLAVMIRGTVARVARRAAPGLQVFIDYLSACVIQPDTNKSQGYERLLDFISNFSYVDMFAWNADLLTNVPICELFAVV